MGFQPLLVPKACPCPRPYQGEEWMCGAYAISQNAAAAAEMLNFGNEPLAASVDAFVLGSVASS